MLQFVTKSDKELLKLIRETNWSNILDNMVNCYAPKDKENIKKIKELIDGCKLL